MSYDETQKQDQADADEEAEERKVRYQLFTGRVINYSFFVKFGYVSTREGVKISSWFPYKALTVLM